MDELLPEASAYLTNLTVCDLKLQVDLRHQREVRRQRAERRQPDLEGLNHDLVMVQEFFTYDHTGRVLAMRQQLPGEAGAARLDSMQYNEIGQTMRNNLGTGRLTQEVDYAYNIPATKDCSSPRLLPRWACGWRSSEPRPAPKALWCYPGAGSWNEVV